MHNAHHFAPELAQATLDYADYRPVLNSIHDRVGEHVYENVMSFPWERIIFASHYLAASLPSDRPFTILHLGIDHNLFSAKGLSDERMVQLERPVIFHPARLLRWKGVLVGVAAFVRLRKELKRGSLVLCDSSLTVDDAAEALAFCAEVREAARAGNVADQVRFLQFDREGMPAAYRASDLVWYPTIDEEPFGLVPLEAMACGVPVIVSHSGGMIETITDNSTGLIVPKGDPAALAAAGLRLLRSTRAVQAFRRRLVAQARQELMCFSIDEYVDKLEELYRQATGRSRNVR